MSIYAISLLLNYESVGRKRVDLGFIVKVLSKLSDKMICSSNYMFDDSYSQIDKCNKYIEAHVSLQYVCQEGCKTTYVLFSHYSVDESGSAMA